MRPLGILAYKDKLVQKYSVIFYMQYLRKTFWIAHLGLDQIEVAMMHLNH